MYLSVRIKMIAILCLFSSNMALSASFKLATYNIRNFGSTEKATTSITELKKILNKVNADVLVVQEIIDTTKFKRFIKGHLPNHKVFFSNCGGAGKQMIGMVYNSTRVQFKQKTIALSLNLAAECNKGVRPALIGHFYSKILRENFTVIGVHLKAGGTPESISYRKKQYRIIKKLVSGLRRKGHQNLAIMGDFNTTDYVLYNRNYSSFIKLVDSMHMDDMSESINCSSYWSGDTNDGIFESSLLDHVLIDNQFNKTFSKRKVQVMAHCQKRSCRPNSPEGLGRSYTHVSDHCPVVATFTN
jgi:endonuclease/exonuclease/phosphatase family metal-dependent hydrolase